ncbi:NAD(P)-dependent alcohol dehydrogenase [Brevibacterium litoralis]|uniref:NAD(P)-dependent alcohol dehydrogenase n=1 Tax=Brevibacterium litoralis TaxID=3138935 RepID=UPI0032EB17D1
MKSVAAYQATAADQPLAKATIERRDLRPDDVMIEIEYAGICHSDIHTVRDEWGGCKYPLAPGHEIIGIVSEVGADVTKAKVGDRVGVGCLVDSCMECEYCLAGDQHYCENGAVGTYNAIDLHDGTVTQGGYSTHVPVREDFVIQIPEGMDPAAATPLLCAGITTYSPLVNWNAGPGKKVAVVGMGGLGHVAVKIAAAMGAEVSVFSHSLRKKDDGLAYGATGYYSTAEEDFHKPHRRGFDIIIDTVSVPHDINQYLKMLRPNGAHVLLGLPEGGMDIDPRMLIGGRHTLAGSNIGGIRETQEMIDFCAEHGVLSEIELISADQINEAYDRVVASDVRYRFVIDAKTF